MCRAFAVMCLIAAPLAMAQAALSPAAQPSYEAAVQAIREARYGAALALLNKVAQDNPRVAEVFASRCSAQIGLAMNPGAEADCNYALSLKPTLSSAVFGLATAQDNQGKSQAAVRHYQQYSAMPDASPSLVQRASARVQALQAPLQVAEVPLPPTARPAPAPAPAPAAPTQATLFVYRNHLMGRQGAIPIMVDSVVVGEILHDSFIEILLPAGDHTVDACLGGLRQSGSGLPNIQINTNNGTFGASISAGGSETRCVRPFTLPVQVRTGGPTYVNFDTQGYDIFLQERPPAEADGEMRHDCRKAFTKKL
jgi:hypothetical protein